MAPILVVAFGVRLVWVLAAPVDPRGAFLWDMTFYDYAALQVADGILLRDLDGVATARWTPGYPLLLGGTYAIFGTHLLVGKLLNVVLATLTVAATGLLGARLAEFRDLPQPEREFAENRAEVRRAVRYMLSHPLRELSLVPRRWRELFAHDHEAHTWAAPRGSRGEIVGPVFGDVWDRRVARLADAAFYAVVLLALAGLPACFDSRHPVRLLLPGTLLYTLFLHGLLFAGDARFHAPLYPTLAILAPVGALVLWRAVRGRLESHST